jgi:ABC-type branched-subunit amino acid transport system substrate-binding protein
VLEDDGSRPARAVTVYGDLLRRCEIVLGPYGSDCVRAVARKRFPGALWNHGGAADDVQRLTGVVSISSPSSRYLVALGRAVASLRPGCRVALAVARGRFARLAREQFVREVAALGLELVGVFSLSDPPGEIAAARPDAVLLCGPVADEISMLESLRFRLAAALLGSVAGGLSDFPRLLGGDPEGMIAPVQWHQDVVGPVELGPTTAELLGSARALGFGRLDYVAMQALACGLIAGRCNELAPDEPLAAARELRTTTFFGGFALDPRTGLQRGHRLCTVRWRAAEQELVLVDAA